MEFEQELQKLNDFYNDGYLVQDEYERRVKEIYDRFGHNVSQLTESLGQLTTSDAATDNKSNGEALSYDSLNKIVVVYLFDGSAKYTPMLQRSIRSLMTLSPDVYVGLLNLNTAESQISDFIRSLPNPHMVRVRDVTVHFPNWNPTQHKLDIIKFTDEFETVVWLDSDTVLMKDFRPFLLKFHHSKQQYALIKDRVNYYEEFKNKWCGRKDFVFIPQACLMGFKRDTIKTIFDLWEVMWFEWITPTPFTKFPDPYPSFHASAFCIEQYALGMAIEKLLADSNNFNDVVYLIPRRDVVVLSYNWKFSDVVKKILEKVYMFGEPGANASPESRAVKTLGQILAARTGKPESLAATLSSASTLLATISGASSASYGYSSATTAASSASYGYSSASYGGYSSAVSSASYGPYSSAVYGEYSSASTAALSSASYGGYSSAVSSASYGPYSSASYGSSGSLLSSAYLSSASSALIGSSGSSFGNLESGLLYDIVVDSFEDDAVLHYYSVNYTKFNVYED